MICAKFLFRFKKKFGEVILILENSTSFDESGVDYKKLSGQKKYDNYYRIRVGNWRMGVEMEYPSVICITILHREEITSIFHRTNIVLLQFEKQLSMG